MATPCAIAAAYGEAVAALADELVTAARHAFGQDAVQPLRNDGHDLSFLVRTGAHEQRRVIITCGFR